MGRLTFDESSHSPTSHAYTLQNQFRTAHIHFAISKNGRRIYSDFLANFRKEWEQDKALSGVQQGSSPTAGVP